MKKMFDIGDDQADALERLAAELKESQVGIVRTGIRIFREAVGAARHGGRLAIIGPDNAVTRISGPWDDVRPEPVAKAG